MRSDMTRLILSLDEREKSWLKRRSQETGESIAQIIRQAVQQLEEADQRSLDETLAATRGLWRKGDGLQYQRRIRREWK
jgi:hypothetical protein